MIKVYVFGSYFDQPDASPFCGKAITLLKMSGLPFETRKANLQKAPKGKAPYMLDDGVTIADSSFIRFHLENNHGIDFDPGLSDVDKAVAWAFEKMCEDQLYWATVRLRWMSPDNFKRGPAVFFKTMPAVLRPLIVAKVKKDVKSSLHGQGFGRHTNEELAQLVNRCLGAISVQLGDKSFLMGDEPCGADASVFTAVDALLSNMFDSPYGDMGRDYANLKAYTARCRERWFPELA